MPLLNERTKAAPRHRGIKKHRRTHECVPGVQRSGFLDHDTWETAEAFEGKGGRKVYHTEAYLKYCKKLEENKEAEKLAQEERDKTLRHSI